MILTVKLLTFGFSERNVTKSREVERAVTEQVIRFIDSSHALNSAGDLFCSIYFTMKNRISKTPVNYC